MKILDFVPVTNHNPHYSQYEIGDYTYGSPRILFPEDGRLKIGKFCSIAGGVTFLLGGYHRIDWGTTYPFGNFFEGVPPDRGIRIHKGDITVGHDVYLGEDAFILAGVTIGNGAVVGARAVVSRDVAPYSVVVGNPARHIKFRHGEGMVQQMERIAWWNWPLEKIEGALPLLLSEDIAGFVEKYKGTD